MDKKNGVKVTFIETQFVTSDAASFKFVVQLLTGKSACAGTGTGTARPLHRPLPCRADAGADGRSAAGPRSCYVSSSAGSACTAAVTANAGAAGLAAPPCLEEPCLQELHEICDFSELFYAGESERRRGGASYNSFPY